MTEQQTPMLFGSRGGLVPPTGRSTRGIEIELRRRIAVSAGVRVFQRG